MRWTALVVSVVSVAGLGLAPVPPAAAAAPTVELTDSNGFFIMGGGYLIYAACEARAVPGSPTDQVATGTSVTCTVAGASGQAARPGGRATAPVVTTALPGRYLICVTGSATFVDVTTNEILRASAGPICTWQG